MAQKGVRGWRTCHFRRLDSFVRLRVADHFYTCRDLHDPDRRNWPLTLVLPEYFLLWLFGRHIVVRCSLVVLRLTSRITRVLS